MTDKEFDIKIREKVEDASWEVPEGVWEGVSAGLDKAAAGKKRIPPVFWWRFGGVMAAAAAVVFAVILWPGKKGGFAVVEKTDSPEIAVVTETDPDVPVPILTDAGANGPEASGTTAVRRPSAVPTSSSQPIMQASDEATASTESSAASVENSAVSDNGSAAGDTSAGAAVGDPSAGQSVSSDATTQSAKSAADAVAEPVTGFPADPFTEPGPVRQPLHVALSGSGNAIFGMKTGSASARSGIQRAPVRFKAPTQTGVSQAGGKVMYGLPVTAGLGARFYVTPRLSLGTGVDYTFLFRRFSGTYNEVVLSESGSPEVVRSVTSDVIFNDQHFIGVPITLYYDFLQHNRLRAYVHGGGEIEKCVRSHYRIPGGSEIVSFREKVKGVQWSVGAGVGLSVRVSQHLSFYVDPTLRYYFKGSQPASLRTVQPLMVDVNAGFRFDI
jgi:hypothetical protein